MTEYVAECTKCHLVTTLEYFILKGSFIGDNACCPKCGGAGLTFWLRFKPNDTKTEGS